MRLFVIVVFVFVLGVKALKEDHHDMHEDSLEDGAQPKSLGKRWFEFKCGLYNAWKYGCCDGRLYVRKTHACCSRRVVKKRVCGIDLYNYCTYGCCRKGDSAVVYSRGFQKCCGGKVQWKFHSRLCTPQGRE